MWLGQSAHCSIKKTKMAKRLSLKAMTNLIKMNHFQAEEERQRELEMADTYDDKNYQRDGEKT